MKKFYVLFQEYELKTFDVSILEKRILPHDEATDIIKKYPTRGYILIEITFKKPAYNKPKVSNG